METRPGLLSHLNLLGLDTRQTTGPELGDLPTASKFRPGLSGSSPGSGKLKMESQLRGVRGD